MTVKIYEAPHNFGRCDEKDICPTLTHRAGTGGGNVPLVLGSAQANAAICDDGTCPTLTSQMGTGGNNMPLVLNDQGGGVMSISHDQVGTLRAQTHGHEPLVMTKEPIPINTQVVQGRPSDNGRMGSGIGKPGDPANTHQANHSHGVFDMQARVRK